MKKREGEIRFRWVAAMTAAALLLCCAGVLRASTPVLSAVYPRGGQRGTDVDVALGGDRLADGQEVLFYQPGLSVKKLTATTQAVKVQLAIAPDAPLGEHSLRVRTASGISELRTFWVGALPVVEEKEPNSDFASPQKIDANVTVAGAIENEDVDHFAVQLKKGERLTAEVEGIRLGETMFDPYVAILDTNRFELAACDDSALLVQDPVASMIAPADGTYIVQLRDSSYGGNGSCHYRLHVGHFPQPKVAFPAGGKAGTDLAVQFLGDVSGAISKTVHLPDGQRDSFPIFAEQNGQSAPSPNIVRVSPFANVMEAESNNEPKTATVVSEPFPLALNGIIGEKGDVDFFRFKGKKDQVFDINVFARRVRSPLDPVLTVCDANGGALAGNDDTNGPESYLRFTVPSDGEFLIKVTDQLGAGGPEYVYRVEVTPVQPKLTISIPLVANNSQERQTIVVPKGNRFATLVRANRADFGGDLKIESADLPAGVSLSAENMALDVVPVVFEATADAAVSGKLCELTAKCVDPKLSAIKSEFQQAADLVVFGNQVVYYQARVDKLAVAITQEAPFKISIVQPKVPLVQGGSMQLKVVVERKAGFTGPINLAMLFNPPGVGAGGATIAANTNEITLPLNANGDAQVRKWKICVIGNADVNGPLWVSTQLADLEIASPYVGGKLEMATTEQGKPTQVLCSLEQKKPFEGKAKVQLLGLPPNVSAADREISSSDRKVIFDLQTDAKSPVGSHNSLFCGVAITKDGEPIAQSIAGGGVLRIDAPAAAKPTVAAKPAEPAKPAKAPDAPLSRLEKLRMEQASKESK